MSTFQSPSPKKKEKRVRRSQNDSDSDYVPGLDESTSRSRKRTKREPIVKPTTIAQIANLATNVNPNEGRGNNISNMDGDVLAKIKKALALASHEGTGEQEAKAALRVASKLMALHSVTQAEVLATEDNTQKLKRAGMSVVAIHSVTDTRVRLSTWAREAADAIKIFFDCKYYTEIYGYEELLRFAFYGLAEQTVAAAHAFEMVYNLILDWSQRNKEAKNIRGKNLYRRGVAIGLKDLAKKEKKDEHQRAIALEKKQIEDARRAEAEEDRRRLARLVNSSTIVEPVSEPDVVQNPTSSTIDDTSSPGPRKNTRVKVEEVQDEDDFPPINRGVSPTPPPADPQPSSREAEDSLIEMDVLWDNSYTPEPSDDDSDIAGGPPQPSYENHDEHEVIDVDEDDEDDEDEVLPDFNDADDRGNLSSELWDKAFERFPLASFQSMFGGLRAKDLFPPLPSLSLAPPPPPPPAQQPATREVVEEPQWKSAGQLVTFRETSVAIADDYLKQQNIKLVSGSKRPDLGARGPQEWAIYKQGKEDAKKIDVKRRRIKGKEDDYHD